MLKRIKSIITPKQKLGPDYACIGFPKCATTYILRKVFAELDFETLTEGEFRMTELGRFQNQITRARFKGKVVAIKQPTIIYHKNMVKTLLKSGCKVIISVRNPVQWIKSFSNYALRNNLDGKKMRERAGKVYSFEDVIYKGKAWGDISIDRGMMSRFIVNHVLNSRYYKRENVHFVVQEEFETEHDKVYGELVAYLNRPEAAKGNHNHRFRYNQKNRYAYFNDSSHDDHLYSVYQQEIESLCLLLDEHTDKDLRAIWGGYYSRAFS